MKSFQINATAAELAAKARAITGIHDVADPDIEEALERLLVSLNTETHLSESGALAMEQRLLRILGNRLRMFKDYQLHPEINDQKIVRPLFLTGGGRTGSTKLHKLIAASGDFKYIKFWQAHTLGTHTGDRNEDPAPRIREAEQYIEWFDRNAPKGRMIHAYDTFEAEEETHFFEQGLFGFFIFAFVYVPSFMMWYAQQDERKQMEFVVKAVKYLQWQFYDGDPRPWVLKYPGYQGMEAILRDMFPDAVMVATHRDSISALTSSVSFFSSYYEAYSDVSKDSTLGPIMLHAQSARAQQFIDTRASHPDLDVLDIGYTELLKSPDAVVKKVYTHAGIELSDRAHQAMLAYERDNAQNKHGTHKYTLEQFSLNREVVEAQFRPYLQQFKDYF